MKKLSLYIFLVLLTISACSEQNQLSKCIEGDCNNGYGTYIYEDGRQYVGEWKDGERHGQGILTNTADGNKYDGEWKYVGQFKNDEPHEQGILTTADGSKWVLENGEVVKKINE